jgi:signal transduction histidine kinase
MTEELESRNLGLLDAIQAKDRFVSTMSHEPRTPLNAVLSYADLLDLGIHGALNEQQSAYVERIVTSARHQLELIGEVLDSAKLNAGQLEVDAYPLDLATQVRDAVALVAPQASAKGLDLTVQPPSEPLPPASGDRLRVRQVLLNLLSNAIKFTDRGGVTIQLELNGGDTAAIRVRDTGSGIGPDELPRVFQDFYQVEGGLNRRHDGSGLGLAMTWRKRTSTAAPPAESTTAARSRASPARPSPPRAADRSPPPAPGRSRAQ